MKVQMKWYLIQQTTAVWSRYSELPANASSKNILDISILWYKTRYIRRNCRQYLTKNEVLISANLFTDRQKLTIFEAGAPLFSVMFSL